jgi:hypothetical protein
MKIVLTKNISCVDTAKCMVKIKNKIETLTGDFSTCGHVSIQHEQKNHKVWLFLYDNDGKHESESQGKTIIQETPYVKKYTGKKITQKQIKDLL